MTDRTDDLLAKDEVLASEGHEGGVARYKGDGHLVIMKSQESEEINDADLNTALATLVDGKLTRVSELLCRLGEYIWRQN